MFIVICFISASIKDKSTRASIPSTQNMGSILKTKRGSRYKKEQAKIDLSTQLQTTLNVVKKL